MFTGVGFCGFGSGNLFSCGVVLFVVIRTGSALPVAGVIGLDCGRHGYDFHSGV
jgi:hypothetical protein